jgi:hypothetical protein
MKIDTSILGKEVRPLVKWNAYVDPDYTTGGQHHYMKGEERTKLVNKAAKYHWDNVRKENREQKWFVHGIFSDGTYELLSELGYSQKGLQRNDFRLINKK